MKKLIRNIILACLLAIAAFQIIRSTSHIRDRDIEAAVVAANPPLTVYTLAGDTADIRYLGNDHPSVVVYFSPDCDHCQREAKSLRSHLADFRGIPIIMLSLEGAAETREFSRAYKLDSTPEVRFYLDRNHQFPLYFQTRGYPIILIYNSQHHLTRLFQGETSPADIIRALPKG